MKKENWKTIRQGAAILCAALILIVGSFEFANHVLAQTTGYRFTDQGMVFQGQNGGVFFEPSFLTGPDSGLQRIQPGSIGLTLGRINSGWATLANAPVVALATATTGGTIPAGTSYRLGIRYVTITGGSTIITASQEATQTTTGATSTITVTAPIAAAGAAGYTVDSTNASGVGGSNVTLTELTQPMTATVCAGAFQVNGPNGPATGLTVCPFGVNALLTSLVFTAPTTFTPNIPGSSTFIPAAGTPTPVQNNAFYPAAIPETICNFVAQTANTTVTTIQAMATCPLSANAQNSSGKILHITGHIIYTTAGAPIITVSALEGGITPIAVSGVATTGAATNGQVAFDYYVTTALTGTAGTLEPHGLLYVQNNTALGTALGVYADQNVAVSAAINLAAANSLTLNITATVALSTATLRDAQVVLLN